MFNIVRCLSITLSINQRTIHCACLCLKRVCPSSFPVHNGKTSTADCPCRQLYFVLSGVCLLIGVTTTHGLGGQLRHASALEAGDEISQQWRFFQPFQCAPSQVLDCCITPAWRYSLQPLPEPLLPRHQAMHCMHSAVVAKDSCGKPC